MSLWLNILLFVLNIINVFLHSTGIYLLYCLYKRCRYKIQQLYLINLSIGECLMNLFEALKLFRLFVSVSNGTAHTLDRFIDYLSIVQFTGIAIVIYCVMIYITLDRLLDISLNIKYSVYWDEYKAKYLLILTWVLSAIYNLTTCLMYRFVEFDWKASAYKYIFPTFEFSFVVLAVITYSYVFRKFKQSRIIPTTSGSGTKKNVNAFTVFRNSKFFVSVLIILTFLLFMVIPDLVYLFVGTIGGNESPVLLTACWISYAISNIADACIYIFLQPAVRRSLWKKLKLDGQLAIGTERITLNGTQITRASQNNNNNNLNEIATVRSSFI